MLTLQTPGITSTVLLPVANIVINNQSGLSGDEYDNIVGQAYCTSRSGAHEPD